MVGGTIFHRKVIHGEISRVLVLNLLWQNQPVLCTGQEHYALDIAFALIEGHPQSGDASEIKT
jgi:hypothetical protein